MLFKHFPKYEHDAFARCFQCDGHVVDHRSTEDANGNGSRRAYCERCHMFTYYDLIARGQS